MPDLSQPDPSQPAPLLALTPRGPTAEQLSSILEALDILEKKWSSYQVFMDKTAPRSPQVSALLTKVNEKCQRVYNLLDAIVARIGKRPRVEPSQSNLTQRLLENGRPAEANLNLDEDDDGPPNLSKRRRVVPSDDEASGDEGRRLESAAGSQVDAGGEDGDGDGDGDGRGASEPRGQPDSGEDGDNGSVGSEVRSQAGDGGDDGGEQSDRNKTITVQEKTVKDSIPLKIGQGYLGALKKWPTQISCAVRGVLTPIETDTLAKAEGVAFRRMLMGYANIEDLDEDEMSIVDNFLAPYRCRRDPVGACHRRWVEQEKVRDIKERLLSMHLELMRTETKSTAEEFVYTMLAQVQTLQFCFEFSRMSSGRGGGTWKANFNKATFQQSDKFGHIFAGLNDADKETRMAAMADEYQEWAKMCKETVTRRNMLLSMYKTFGAALLLETIWNVHGLRHRSKFFRRVCEIVQKGMVEYYTQLEEDLDEEELSWETKHANASKLCVFLVKKLATEESMATYVQNFFEKYPIEFSLNSALQSTQ